MARLAIAALGNIDAAPMFGAAPHHEDASIRLCVVDVLHEISKGDDCARRLALVAPPQTTAHELRSYCGDVAKRVTVEDAQRLCRGLHAVEAAFWSNVAYP